MKEWGEKDSATAAEWVRDLEFEGGPGSLYEPLITSWSGYDPKAAREWIGSLNDTDKRAAAAKEYVEVNVVYTAARHDL